MIPSNLQVEIHGSDYFVLANDFKSLTSHRESLNLAPAVLLIAFNRPDLMRLTLESIKCSGTKKLFVAIDGPRKGNESDQELVRSTRALAESIDWVDELRIRVSNINLGCRQGVISAISWFFSEVDSGIIVEDDIILHPTFFEYCKWSLSYFYDSPKIGFVSGCNFVPREFVPQEATVRFNYIPHVTGWATWRRVWDQFEISESGKWPSRIPLLNLLRATGFSIAETLFWLLRFREVRTLRVDTWDYALVRSAFQKMWMTVSPSSNLAEHTGWREDATHTKGDKPAYIQPLGSWSAPVGSELSIHPHRKSQMWTRRNVYRISGLRILKELLLETSVTLRRNK
jgi:hypothetical protein